jgi:hypothetical protein
MKKMAAQERALFWQHTDRYRSDQDFGDPSHMSEETSKDYSRYLAYLIQEDPDLRSALAAQKAVANAF